MPGYAIQVARPLTEVDHTLDRIRLFLIIIAAGGIAVAAALGLLVSRAALAPVRRLTTATENVTETGDLSERIESGGQDELGRLAVSFNSMLGALEESNRTAAPARLGRVPRAPHSAHEPADEHRGPRARPVHEAEGP